MSDDRNRAKVMGLLQRLQTVYGPPPGHDEETVASFYDEYVKALSTFDGKLLGKAGDRLLRTCKFWPRPSEIVEVIEHITPTTVSNDGPAQKAIRHRNTTIQELARAYMRECPSSLIDMAMRQGWGRSLEDVARDVIRKCYERDGDMPTMAMMVRFRMPREDVEYYARFGQPHLKMDADEIMAARQQTGAAQPLSEASRRMMGDVA